MRLLGIFLAVITICLQADLHASYRQSKQKSRTMPIIIAESFDISDRWLQELSNDGYKHNARAQLMAVPHDFDVKTFSNLHPSVQCLAANLIITGKHQNHVKTNDSLLYLADKPDELGIALLIDAAENKNYLHAKKALTSYYYAINDEKNGLYWLLATAEDGSAEAMSALTIKYWGGNGASSDHIESMKWAILADKRGDVPAHSVIKLLGSMCDLATDADFIEAFRRAERWERQHSRQVSKS